MPGATVHPAVAVPRALRTEIGRTALLEILTASDAEIVALIAPSGYGKSTLLAQHARAAGRPVFWLTFSDSDSDVDFFLTSLQRAAVALGTAVDLGTEPTPERSIHRLAAALLGDPRKPGVYFDGVEVLSEQTGRLLGLLIQALTGLRVYLSGFTMDVLPLARWVAAGQVVTFEQQQLSFTPEETSAFLQTRGLTQDLGELAAGLEGWPAGVALATSASQTLFGPQDLIREALHQLPAPLRAVLPDLSVLPEWNEAGAQQLGIELPAGWTERLRRAGLPLTPLGRGWYRPHQLLLTFLTELAQRDPPRIRALHALQASRLAESDPLGALRHAKRAGAWAVLADLAAQVFPRLKSRGEFKLIHSVMQDLTTPDLPPWMHEYAAVAQVEVGEVDAGERHLRALHGAGLTTALGYTALALLATRRGDYAEQLRLTEEGLARFPAAETSALLLQRAGALISLGQFQAGLEVCRSAALQARQQGTAMAEASALSMQQYAHQMLHQWAERHQVVRRAYTLMEDLQQSARLVPLLNVLAEEDLLSGHTELAEHQLQRAFTLADVENPVMLPQLHLTQARLHAVRDDLPAARSALDQAEVAARRLRLSVVLPFVLLSRYEVLLADSLNDEAERTFQDVGRMLNENPQAGVLMSFARGLRAFVSGQADTARHAFQAALANPDRTQQVRARMYLLDLRRQAGTLGEDDLGEAVAALDGLAARAVLSLDRVHLRPLLEACRAVFPGQALAHLLPAPSLPGTEAPTLKIRALGPLTVEAEGRPVRLPLTKSAEILVWLAWHTSGTLAELLDALWDGSNEGKHHEYFRVALRRLRSSLLQAGQWPFDPVPFEGGRYRLNPALHVALDVREVLQAASHGETALLTALERYQGEFLSGWESEWVAALRERTRLTLLDAALDAARLADREQAARLLDRALTLDPHSDRLNVALIQALLPDHHAAALGAFREYARRLKTDLDQEVPGQVMEALAKSGLPLDRVGIGRFPGDSQDGR